MRKTTRPRDAEATKRSVLRAAETIFAEKGFAGTSIREISRASGVSGPLILFHFQTKEGVYKAVKAAIVERYADQQATLATAGKPVREFVKDFIDSMFAFYRDNPTMMRLATWGRLEGDVDPWPGEAEAKHANEEYLREAQRRGEIRDNMSPGIICTIISGAVHIWWEYHSTFVRRVGPCADGAGVDERYAEQLLEFVLRGLSPDPGEAEEAF